MLVAIGGLIGLDKLAFWPICAATEIGAALGDLLSYWIGHIYRERIEKLSSSPRYQRLFAVGKRYFVQHGGKSVAIGRFVPAVKSVVPVIVGATGMPRGRFTAVNAISACAWAAAHLLPGVSAVWTLGGYGLPESWDNEFVEIAVALGTVALIVWLAKLILDRRRSAMRKLPALQTTTD